MLSYEAVAFLETSALGVGRRIVFFLSHLKMMHGYYELPYLQRFIRLTEDDQKQIKRLFRLRDAILMGETLVPTDLTFWNRARRQASSSPLFSLGTECDEVLVV